MKPDLPPQLRALFAEVKANPRLQLGAVLIGALILGWLMLVLSDWRTKKLEGLQQARQRLEQIESLAGQQGWAERAEAATQLATALEAEIPPAASAGLAQADFQGWLREIVNGQDASLRLDVLAPVRVEQPAGVVRLTATISGSLPPARVVQMIHRIERRAALSTIPTLTIRSDGLNRTFSLTVQAFYRMPSEATEA